MRTPTFLTGLMSAVVLATGLTACSPASPSPAGPSATTSAAATTTPAAGGSTTSGQATVKNFDSTSPQAWSATFQVISGPKGVVLIDPGKYDDEVASYVAALGGVDAIMITHGHWDKLRGLDAALKANPKAVAYIHELDKPYLTDPVRNCSIEDGFEGRTNAPVTTFTEGTRQVAGYTVRIIHLPGHTEGSSIFVFDTENLMIGGDAIMANLVGSSRHPGGNESDRKASIAKFKAMTFPAGMRVYDGHTSTPTTYEQLLKTNVDLK